MIVYAISIPLLLLAAVVDSSVLVQLRYLNGQPSLVLMLVVAWGLLNDLGEAFAWAIIGGICLDLLSTVPTGTSSLAFVLAVYLLERIFGRVGRRNIVLPPLAALLTTLLLHSLVLMMMLFTGSPKPIGESLLTWTLPSMAFNMLGTLIIFRLMGGLLEFFRPPRAAL